MGDGGRQGWTSRVNIGEWYIYSRSSVVNAGRVGGKIDWFKTESRDERDRASCNKKIGGRLWNYTSSFYYKHCISWTAWMVQISKTLSFHDRSNAVPELTSEFISDAAGSVLNRKTEPKCQKPNRTNFFLKPTNFWFSLFKKKLKFFLNFF